MLPLSRSIRKIAVLGPNANLPVMGDYCMEPDYHAVTLLEGIREVLGVPAENVETAANASHPEIVYDKGCNILGAEIKPLERWWFNAKPRPAVGITEIDYGFTAEYFNGADFSGEPVLTRLDSQINFNWIYHAPDDKVDSRQFPASAGRQRCAARRALKEGSGYPVRTVCGCILTENLLLMAGEKIRKQARWFRFSLRAAENMMRVEFRNDARGVRVIFGYDHGEETIDRAIRFAKESDLAIVALGDSTETSGENFDRTTLNLHGKQLDFLKAVYETVPRWCWS